MAYQLGQYNKNPDSDNDIFMTLITEGTPRRKQAMDDTGASGTTTLFENECIQISGFIPNKNYYFHGKIKRMTSDQVFYIKLVNYEQSASEEQVEQYIKTINVAKGDSDDWVDVEFLFTPLTIFDSLLFELQRTVEDYREEKRYPVIIYEELSEINNLIPRKINDGSNLIKIGVQSHPGLLMCINGEEIRTCRTGVYEIKNGLILVSFFSVVAGAIENTSILEDQINEVNELWAEAEMLPTPAEREAAKAAIHSRSIIDSSKTRQIDGFTLDYLYKED